MGVGIPCFPIPFPGPTAWTSVLLNDKNRRTFVQCLYFLDDCSVNSFEDMQDRDSNNRLLRRWLIGTDDEDGRRYKKTCRRNTQTLERTKIGVFSLVHPTTDQNIR